MNTNGIFLVEDTTRFLFPEIDWKFAWNVFSSNCPCFSSVNCGPSWFFDPTTVSLRPKTSHPPMNLERNSFQIWNELTNQWKSPVSHCDAHRESRAAQQPRSSPLLWVLDSPTVWQTLNPCKNTHVFVVGKWISNPNGQKLRSDFTNSVHESYFTDTRNTELPLVAFENVNIQNKKLKL